MKKLLFLSLFIPALAIAQNNLKEYGTISVGPVFRKNSDVTVDARLSAGFHTRDLYIGVGGGYMSGFLKPYFPVFMQFAFGSNTDKGVFPMVFVEPGYGIYNSVLWVGSRKIITTGGFAIFAGGGVGFSTSDNSKVILNVGYSNISFSTNNVRTPLDGISLRLNVLGLN